jgi:hypothetical protein
MRLARTGRTGVALAVAGVLLTAASWGVLAVTSNTATGATTPGAQSCQPLQAAAAPATPSAVAGAGSGNVIVLTAAMVRTRPLAGAAVQPAAQPAWTTPPDTTSPATTPSDTTSPATTPPDTTSPATTPPDTTPPATTPPATTPPATTQTAVNLCVAVTAVQQSSEPGTPIQWSVTAWAVGGNVPNATIQLQATPASAGTPQFSFGCASGNGTGACALGTVDAGSAQRQLQAQLTVPVTAAVTSVILTATGSAVGLLTNPQASAPISILPAASATPSLPTGLPSATPTPSASPGGSAASLFPTVSPSASTGGSRQVASTSVLPAGDHLAVQLAGVAALLVAFILAVTRVSFRRSTAVPPGGAATPPSAAPPPAGPDEPTRALGGIGEPARRSRGAESAKRLRTLSARGRRAQGGGGARHKRG